MDKRVVKLLIVTEIASIHAARWIKQLDHTKWDIHVFQAIAKNNGINDEFNKKNIHVPFKIKSKKNKYFHSLFFNSDNILLKRIVFRFQKKIQAYHEKNLLKLINKWKPDIIHSLGLNINWENQCLPVYRTLLNSKLKYKPKWLYSTWGSDLDYYAKLSKVNNENIKNILRKVDYLVTECERDLRLAREMDFNGQFMGFFTGFGGVKKNLIDYMNKAPQAATRKNILLKGRSLEDGDPIGRAMNALKAFKECEDFLKDYNILILSAGSLSKICSEAKILSESSMINIKIVPYISYEELLKIFASARVFISLTINDGIPSSLLEAMTAGVFPIFSDLEPLRDIVKHNENGLLVNPENIDSVVSNLKQALINDDLVNKAEVINKKIINEKYNEDFVTSKTIKLYENIYNDIVNINN